MKEQTVTFEEIKLAMLKWAYYFANRRFDPWELINSAWLYGKVRFLPKSKIKLASKRIKWDMIEYMRLRDGLKSRRFAESQGRHIPDTNNLSDIGPEDEDFTSYLPAKNPDIDAKDTLDFITNHPSLSRTEKLILKLYYIQGFYQQEIAKIIGVSEGRISQVRTDLLKRLEALNYSKIA